MKKLVTLLVVSLFGLTALWAGGQGESAGASSAQSAQTTAPVTIDFWTTQTQSDRMATIQVLIDTFEALNPEVTIKLVAVDENDMATQLNTAAASNTLPGMIECAAENAVAFGSEGLLDSESITHLINSIGKDKFYAGPLALNESSTKGSYYAVPYHGWVQGIWYRADWFEEAGLNAPFTWDDILTAARYFDKPDQTNTASSSAPRQMPIPNNVSPKSLWQMVLSFSTETVISSSIRRK